jgi:hypothetical protein
MELYRKYMEHQRKYRVVQGGARFNCYQALPDLQLLELGVVEVDLETILEVDHCRWS